MVKKEGDRLLRSVYIAIIIVALLLIIAFFTDVYSRFRIGDIVYKRDSPFILGEITGISFFRLSYLVEWTDKSISLEFYNNLAGAKSAEKYLFSSGIKKSKGSKAIQFNKEENFSDYNFDRAIEGVEEGESSIVYISKGISEGLGYNVKCIPEFYCSDFGECIADYNFNELIDQSQFSGRQYRYCKDNNKCMPDLVDSKECSNREEIKIDIVYRCGEEQIGVIGQKSSGSINLMQKNKKGYADIDVNVIGEGYCYYCFDGIRDYDEKDIDCGGSCPKC
jgi:hypothetical protein